MQWDQFAKVIRWSSCTCATTGGIILASNTELSGFGFILLALSSGQMLLSSLILGDKFVACYSGLVFVFVDCFGVYRWLLT